MAAAWPYPRLIAKLREIFRHKGVFKMARNCHTSILACVIAILAGAVTCAQAQNQDRDPWLQPFSSSSLWNTSIGSGAQWSSDGDADSIDLRSSNPFINAGTWSM